MGDEESINSCGVCRNLNLILTIKEEEIQNLKLQIKELNIILHRYRRRFRTCKLCCDSNEFDSEIYHESDHSIDNLLESITDSVEVTNINVENSETTFYTKSPPVSAKVDDSIQNVVEDSSKENHHSEDYVYDENWKMYYCLSTGYYYEANSGLFYVPQTGAYYKYDYDKKEYELYEAQTPETNSAAVCDSVVDKVSNLNINDEDITSGMKKELDSPNNDSNSEINISIKIEPKSPTQEDITHDSTTDWQPPEGSNTTVTDLVREVAEQSSGMSDYIYDEQSQMYYSKSTGYFYDPVKKMLYDPQTRNYYLYIQETLSYEFYCKADSTEKTGIKEVCSPSIGFQEASDRLKARKKHWRKKQSLTSHKKTEKSEYPSINVEGQAENDSSRLDEFSSPEDGELFSSDSETEQSIGVQNAPVEESACCPPCIRAIVEESSELKIGSLILITCTGAQIGRKNNNTINIPDIGVSKIHAEIKFNNESWTYNIEDVGSQNGTFVNDLRLSKPKEKSEPQVLNHGDRLTLGSCKLLLHIHEGYDTCDQCEPGQVIAEISSQEVKPTHIIKTKEQKEKERRQEMKKIKQKYGLKGREYHDGKNASAGLGYEDKAEMRRATVGSQNPYEKTEVASMDVVMPSSNKGYQMLKKLGWKEGESLGVTSAAGISEPIPLRPWLNKAGFGSTDMGSPSQSFTDDPRKRKWVKAQERYLKLTL